MKQMCKRMARLLLILTIVAFSVVPGIAMGNEEEPLTSIFSPTEQNLQRLGWHPGHSESCEASFLHHYGYHCTDRGIDGISAEAYLELAVTTCNHVRRNPADYKIVERPPRPGEEPTCKYTHKVTGIYVILGKESFQIYSCGGKHTQNRYRGPDGAGRIRAQRHR